MFDFGPGLKANRPAGLSDPPDGVDVFAHLEFSIEEVDTEFLAQDEARSGYVGDLGPGADD